MAFKNDLEELKNALDVGAFANSGDPIREKLWEKYELDDAALDAYRTAVALENDPNEADIVGRIKKKVFDQVAEKLPVANVQGVTGSERLTLKNIFDTAGPDLQKKYLEDRGYVVTQENGELLVRKPGELQRKRIEEEGLSLDPLEIAADLGDVIVDSIQGASTVAKTTLGPTMAIGAAVGGLTELIKQNIRSYLGYEETPLKQAGESAFQMGMGALGGGLGYKIGKAAFQTEAEKFTTRQAPSAISQIIPEELKGVAQVTQKESILPGIEQPLEGGLLRSEITGRGPRATFPRTQAAAAELGIPEEAILPSMKYDSQPLRTQESLLLKGSSTLGRPLRKQAEKIFQSANAAAEDLVKTATPLSQYQAGESARQGIIDAVAKKLEPAEAIYNSIESNFKFIPVSNDVKKKILSNLDDGLFKYSPTDELKNKIIADVNKMKNLEDLKNLRSTVGGNMTMTSNWVEGTMVDKIYQSLTEQRSEILKKLAPKLDPQIKEADRIWREAIEDISSSLGIRKYQAGVKRSLEEALDAQKLPAEKLIEQIFPLNDYRKLKEMQRVFPSEFNTARDWFLAKTKEKSLAKGKEGAAGEFSGILFGKRISDMATKRPELINLIFGEEGAKKAKALVDLSKVLPYDQNPSGTSYLFEQILTDVMSPKQWTLNAISFKKAMVDSVQKNKESIGNQMAQNILNKIAAPRSLGPGILGTGIIKTFSNNKERK